ncbi:hypothetical protein [Formosa sp. S-31]|uniref:hypothetical protein n=1 Tax=Formosa sp. S-31 TaxID=2790949 RepID=UPI003EB93052
MTLYEFNRLSEGEKFNQTFNKGSFIDSKVEGSFRYALYALDMFFVEIKYNSTKNKFEGLKSFTTGELLDKYSDI